MITRQLFCERCFKANRPYRDNQLLVLGSTGYHLRTVDRFVVKEEKGFVPHLVEPYKMVGDKDIVIIRVCCVVGCGLTIQEDPQDRNKLLFNYRKISYEQLTLKDWNAVVNCKNFGYYL